MIFSIISDYQKRALNHNLYQRDLNHQSIAEECRNHYIQIKVLTELALVLIQEIYKQTYVSMLYLFKHHLHYHQQTISEELALG